MKRLKKQSRHADSDFNPDSFSESDRRIMQISSATKIAPLTLDWAGSQRQSNTASPSSSTAAAQPSSATRAAASASASVSSFTTQYQNSMGNVPVSKLPAPYAAVAEGKSYPGSVEESAGEYVASVPNPPGASASGATVQIAENNLEVKLDQLA
jgi:hypothetical protein